MILGIEWVEWVGYAASIGVATSLLMHSMWRLRIINSIGCILFVIYGILVGAYPVAISNAVIVLINIYQMIGLYKQKENKSI